MDEAGLHRRQATNDLFSSHDAESQKVKVITDNFFEKYRVFEKRGQGGFGSVCRCVDRTDGTGYALKSTDLRSLESTLNECNIMLVMKDCEYILDCYEVYEFQG